MAEEPEQKLKQALQEPGLPRGQVIVGVLSKYINFGKGWRHRLFVLKNGVLRYFKIFGPHSVNVAHLFDDLHQYGDVISIGTETGVIADQCRRNNSQRSVSKSTFVPQGEIHMQVSSVQQSDADNRKFYLHSGTKTLRMRAETKEDRRAWVEALSKARGVWADSPAEAAASSNGSGSRVTDEDNRFLQMLEDTRAALVQKGASAGVQSYVSELLMSQHQQYHAFMTAESDKRRALQAYVRHLENEKRTLETAIVVDERLHNQPHLQRAASEGTTDDADEDDDEAEHGSDGSTDPGSDEIFYDCDGALQRQGSAASAAAPSMAEASSTVNQTESQQEVQHDEPSTRGGNDHASTGEAPLPESDVRLPVPGWLREELPPPPRRERLPKPQQQEKSISLWSIIKECVGKDLTRICLPVYFNEPLSALQKTAEDMEYAELLDKAATFPAQSMERLLHVAAFAVTGYSATAERTQKPFNPLLGETFEFVYPEKGYRALVEKVVHHPTILAAHCEGRCWQFSGDAEVRSRFWGSSIELTPVGLLRLHFNDGDDYTWTKVTSSINNLIIGKINIDHGGIMRISNLQSKAAVRVKFKETGLLGRSAHAHQVKGVLERDGQVEDQAVLTGKWDSSLSATYADGRQEVVWKRSPPAKEPTRYNLSEFAIKLNEMTPGLEERLAPTDCRLRPDQHYLELGMYIEANAEKQRLETKQRAARKAAERGDPIEPRWFRKLPNAQPGVTPMFEYKGGYWESRKQGRYDSCRDIFGPDVVQTAP